MSRFTDSSVWTEEGDGPHQQALKEEGSGMQGLTIEDNLSSHMTEEVLKFREREPTEFAPPEFVPPRITEVVQVIDCHLTRMRPTVNTARR